MNIHVSENADALSVSAAEWMIDHINKVLSQKEKFSLVLSGGNTPKKLHTLLASDNFRNKIDWSRIDIFWGDERFVSFNDERNNAAMAFDTLLDHVPVKKENIHIMQTENISPEESALQYEKLLKNYFHHSNKKTNPSTFDLVLSGMGDDGHTLSLFPGMDEIILEKEKWCASLWLQSQDMYRITLTAPVVNAANAVAFLVSGKSKASSLHEVLYGNFDPHIYPSQIIKPMHGELHWFVDREAMGSRR